MNAHQTPSTFDKQHNDSNDILMEDDDFNNTISNSCSFIGTPDVSEVKSPFRRMQLYEQSAIVPYQFHNDDSGRTISQSNLFPASQLTANTTSSSCWFNVDCTSDSYSFADEQYHRRRPNRIPTVSDLTGAPIFPDSPDMRSTTGTTASSLSSSTASSIRLPQPYFTPLGGANNGRGPFSVRILMQPPLGTNNNTTNDLFVPSFFEQGRLRAGEENDDVEERQDGNIQTAYRSRFQHHKHRLWAATSYSSVFPSSPPPHLPLLSQSLSAKSPCDDVDAELTIDNHIMCGENTSPWLHITNYSDNNNNNNNNIDHPSTPPPIMPMMNTPDQVPRGVISTTVPSYKTLKMRRMGGPPPCV